MAGNLLLPITGQSSDVDVVGAKGRGSASVPLLSGDAAERQNGTTTAAEPSDKDCASTLHELTHMGKPDSHLLAMAFACGCLPPISCGGS
jgi:hypothetical protein